MVAERRELVFFSKDLIEAIRIFPNRASLRMPEGRIYEITIEDDPQVHALIQVIRSTDTQKEDVILDASILAAIMLFYCRAYKIPIPKNAIKKITKVGLGLCLDVSLNDHPPISVPLI